ncbi:MAG: hypothetical protein AAF383_00720 [Cyanobacteria bacterium P01_A01_bin.83]
MRGKEIIRIIVFAVIGLGLMFWLQPLVYRGRYIRVSDYEVNGVPAGVEAWIADNYMICAGIVFVFSLLATLLWSFFTAKAQIKGAIDVSRWQVMWWLLGLLPIAGIAIALIFFNQSDQALLSLAGFLVFDGLIWLFWLSTATSSPGMFKNIPPGSFMLRRLIG